MVLVNASRSGEIGDKLRAIAAPIFMATVIRSAKGEMLTVHVSSLARRKEAETAIRSALGSDVRVKFHSPASLAAPRSLERLVRRFKSDDIVYDPTESMTRARALVDGAIAVRSSLGSKLSGLFYAPRLRTLFVALNARTLVTADKVKVADLAGIERSIRQSLGAAFADQSAACPAVRVGFGLPLTELVPVDQRSVVSFGRRVVRAVRRYWKPAAIATMLGFGTAGTAAAKDPAVSETNIKVLAQSGETDTESTWFTGGAITLPIDDKWGLHVEGAAAGVGDDNMYGTAAHLFMRDPESYLLGVFAAYGSEDQFDLDATRIGANAEIYLKQVTLLAKAGYQFSDTLAEGFVGNVELKWYMRDNFAVSGGFNFDENETLKQGSIEWMPGFSALPGLAFRIDGMASDDEFYSVLGGISFYFGADASLKDRHRKQDPDYELTKLFAQVQAERDKLCNIYGGCD